MLDVHQLTFDYQDKALFSGLSFSLKAGSLLHLKGANGSGKTTLFYLLAGLLQPLQGLISYQGQAINKELSTYQAKLCFIGHRMGIHPHLTVKEQCYFDLHYENDLSIDALLAVFSLQSKANTLCSLLSAGQKRQLALLRLWMTRASLWLLDEPLVALDEAARKIFFSQVHRHLGRGGSVIVSSHEQLDFVHEEYLL